MGTLLERFITYLTVEKGLSKNTVDAYRHDINKFQRYIASVPTGQESQDAGVTDISKNDIVSYLNHIRDSGCQTPTIARTIASLRSFYLFLLAEGEVDEDVLENLSSPKGWKHLPRVISSEEVLEMTDKPGGTRLSPRDRTMLVLMYSAGLRVSETTGLKLNDINFEAGFITVFGKGSRERIVPVNETALEMIKTYIREVRPSLTGKRKSGNLFLTKNGKPLTRQRLWQLVKHYSGHLSTSVSPHTIRHCFASHLLEGGADLRTLQKMLGHADISTTQIYTRVTPDKLKKVHKQYHPRG